MRHLHRVLASFAVSFAALFIALPAIAQANHTTNITLAKMYANGVPVPYGVVCAVPANQYSNPLTFSEQTWGVVTANSQFCGNVVNGAIAGGINVPDANQTNLAAPISYNFTLQLTNSSGVPTSAPISLYNSVGGVTGATFVLDNYTPSVSTSVPPSNMFGYGTSVPSSCTSPSIWTVPGNSAILTCTGGIYVAPTGTGVSVGTTAGTITDGNDARIVNSVKNQGAWNNLVAYSANDLVTVGAGNTASTYISIITANLGNAPASSPSAWQIVGTPTLPASVASATAMSGLDYWIPFSSGNANDVTGNGHNGTIVGTGTAAAYVLGGIQPNGQTVSIPSASGRPSFGYCAYFPQGQGPLNYGYFYSVAAGAQTGYNISSSYGPLSYNAQTGALSLPVDHYAYAYWPQEASSNGTPLSQSANGYSGNHCVESIPGAATGNIVVDGKEVAYATQASTVSGAVGGAQLTAPMVVAGGNGVQTGLPITVYSVWGTPAGAVDTVAQAAARTAFEVERLKAVGVPFGLSGLNSTATDSVCSFDGTSIDQGFEAGGVPVSTLLTLNFPCTLHDFTITGSPEADMDAAFQDRAGQFFHAMAQRNIAYNGGVTNSLTKYQDTPAQALSELLSWNRKAHSLGYKTIATTMLSRGGSTNGTTNDTLAQQFNQLLLSYADEFDWLDNVAAWPQLGATGANANTTYFNPDGGQPTHPTTAGQVFYIASENAAFNGVYPSVTRTVTANATQLPSDRIIVANCSSACTVSLIDANTANFNSRGKLTVQNVGTAAVTLSAVTGETIGAAQTLAVAAGSSASIIPYEANFTTAGANWVVQGSSGNGGASVPTGTINAPLVYTSPTAIGPASQANFLASGILTGVPKGAFVSGSYGLGDIVQDGSGNSYQSQVANNTYPLPTPPTTTSNAGWKEIGSLVTANPAPQNCNTAGQAVIGLNANFVPQCGDIYGADSGIANAYAVTGVTGTVAVGSEVKMIAANTNTGASTLSVNGTVYPILKKSSAGLVPTVAGDIVATQVYTFAYDGTEMQVSGSFASASNSILFGTGAPTLVPTSASQSYQDTTFSANPLTVDLGRWLPSPHGLFWKNTRTGAISVVTSLGFITTDPNNSSVTCLADYELTETSGTTLHDSCGTNNLTLTQSYPTLTAGQGLTFVASNAGYVSLPYTLASNNYTYQISATIPTGSFGWQNPTLLGTSVNGGSALLFDHTNTPAFTNYQQLVAQTTETNTPFAPAGPTSILFQLSGMTGNQQWWEGTVKVPMSSVGTTYNFGSVTAGTFYLGNQDGSSQKTFNGIIRNFSVWSGTQSDELATWLQGYRDWQAGVAGYAWSADGPLINPHNPVAFMVGDSIDAAIDASLNAEGGAPGFLAAALANNATIINAGVGSAKMCSTGNGIGTIAGNVANMLPFVRARAPQVTNFAMFLQGATNDFAAAGLATAVLTCTKAAIDAGHANGFKVIAETVLPRAPLLIGASATAQLNSYNSLLLAANYADATIDFDSDPQFQYPYQNVNISSFDATHPFDALYQVKAARYRNEANRINIFASQDAVTDTYSATMNFDLSTSLQHTVVLGGSPSYYTVTGENPGTKFSLFFQQPATGPTYTVPYASATTGSGAAVTYTLSGGVLTPNLTANGNGFYKTGANTPMIVPQVTGCTTNSGRTTPTITSGNIASVAQTTASVGCTTLTSSSAIIFNPELIWNGSPTMPSSSDANGKITRLQCEVDSTKTNVFCTN